MKLRIRSMIWNIRKQKQPIGKQKEERRLQNNEDSINSLSDKLKRPNIHIMGVPEGQEKEQEIA